MRHELSAHQLQSLLLELRVGESIRVGFADTPIAMINLLKKTGTKAVSSDSGAWRHCDSQALGAASHLKKVSRYNTG